MKDNWGAGDAYERYVGRWSRQVAVEFLAWLDVEPGARWADVGCGTGALSRSILAVAAPASILALDRAEGFLQAARSRINAAHIRFSLGSALALPWRDGSCDAAVSGLVLNFVPEPGIMINEMRRVTRPGGVVSVYVWDYADGMQMMRHFWDVAGQVDPQGSHLDEARRFPICQPEPLAALFEQAGLANVSVRPITIQTIFQDFDDYWTPFLGEQGAAPTYLASLDTGARDRVRDALKALLPTRADGSIALAARAWAVKAHVPHP